MSISSWIEIAFHSKHPRYETLTAIIHSFKQLGWNYRNTDGSIQYLPVDDDGMFNWQSGNLADSAFFEIARKKCVGYEIVGFVIYQAESNIGMDVLFNQNNTISFSLLINRKKTASNRTDVSWYIDSIVHAINLAPELHIESIKFEETY